MKKSLVLGFLGLAATAMTSFGQGVIILDNYNLSVSPLVKYGANVPANGVSGSLGTVGSGLLSGWTAGIYFFLGNSSGSVAADPAGVADPGTLGGGLTLATGNGSSAAFHSIATGFTLGAYLANQVFSVPGSSAAGDETVTLEIVAYSGSSYVNSSYRGHSAAFTLVTSANTSVTPVKTGSAMPSFSVFAVPEPSVFALAGLSGAFLMLIRRK